MSTMLFVLQYCLTLLAVLVGFTNPGNSWKFFGWLNVACLVLLTVGIRKMKGKDKPTSARSLGAKLVWVSCIPTLPVSLLFGWIAAGLLLKKFGITSLSASGAASVASEPANGETAGVKKYYARKIFGSGAYYLGLFYAAILVILLFTKHYQAAAKNSFPTFFAIYFGLANRKPRIILTPENIIAYNLFASQTFPLANVERVEADKKFSIILKTGKPFPLAKWEFSQATREAVARDVAGALININ